ncbi:(2Fe-2S)-binding protein [Modicisalibacter luteus]
MPTLTINGDTHQVDVPEDMPLLWVLRDVLGMTGTKYGCGIAQCGACTVHLDGNAVRSCVLPVGGGRQANRDDRGYGELGAGQKRSIGLARTRGGAVRLLPVRADHVGRGIAQQDPQPDDKEIDLGMSGNLCRCCTYTRIRGAIKSVAKA